MTEMAVIAFVICLRGLSGDVIITMPFPLCYQETKINVYRRCRLYI